METYIDDVAGGWASDIKGEPVKISGINNNSGDVVLPGAFIRASDVRVYYMTYAGQEAFQHGLPTSQMKEGIHYYLAGIIPYRPTPENFYGNASKEETKVYKGIKIRKQAPLRIKH